MPDLARLRADRSVYALAARHFRDPRLRILFSFHPLFIGGDPTTASSIYALVPFLEQAGGVHYAHGGMHAVVTALVEVFRGPRRTDGLRGAGDRDSGGAGRGPRARPGSRAWSRRTGGAGRPRPW